MASLADWPPPVYNAVTCVARACYHYAAWVVCRIGQAGHKAGIAGFVGGKALISHRGAAAGLLLLTLLAGAVIGFSPGHDRASGRAAAASASHNVQPIGEPPPIPTRSAPTLPRPAPMLPRPAPTLPRPVLTPPRSARTATVGPRRPIRVAHNQFTTPQVHTRRVAPPAPTDSTPPPPQFYVTDGTSGLAAPANTIGTGEPALHPATLPGVALTFDDGPSPLYTPQVLDVLRRYQTPATFFVVGYHALQYPDLVRAEARAGMTVGDHSFDHPNYPPFAALTTGQIDTEIARGRDALRGLAPPPRLFRPPGGSFSPYVEAAAHRLGLRVTLWSVDPTDWAVGVSSGQIVARVLGAVRPGSIVIMHDGGGNRAATVAALPAIIAGIRARGLRLVALHG